MACDDDNPCTDDICTPPDGCRHEPNNVPCDDQDPCSGRDRCESGTCRGGAVDKDSDADGYLDAACGTGDDCDDGDFRVHPGVDESRADGTCTDLMDNDCDDDIDQADLTCWTCVMDGDCDDGNLCNGNASCVSGACVDGTELVCDDGVYCNGTEGCEARAGCVAGIAPCAGPDGDTDCAESCDEESDDCLAPDGDGISCANDGLYCTGEEVCQAGACEGSGSPCAASWHCDELRGLCAEETWSGFGGSELAPWSEHVGSSAWGGGISGDPEASWYPALAVDSAGAPVVAWLSGSGGIWRIRVKRLSGGAWVSLGGDLGAMPIATMAPVMVLDVTGNPLVAWSEMVAPDYEIYLLRFDGSDWVEVGTGSASGTGVSAGGGWATDPALVMDGLDNPVLAWSFSTGGNSEIHVKRFDGSAWIEAGAGSASGPGVSATAGDSLNPSLALDPSGQLAVAWEDDTSGNDEIYLKLFDGGAWVEAGAGSASAGGVSASAGSSRFPALGTGGTGGLVLAWQDSTAGNFEIYLRRFNGVVWQELGGASASGSGLSANTGASVKPALAVDAAGLPVLAWMDNSWGNDEIYLKRYDGASWIEVGGNSATAGGVSANSGTSSEPSLALDVAGNPVLAWQDWTSGNEEVYVRRFDGVWGPVGDSNGAGGGVSASSGGSFTPLLALDTAGDPLVAWQDASAGNSEIYVKRFAGAWQEIGTGSASGMGVSATSGWSGYLALALDANDFPWVAWSDATPGFTEIYVRRFDGVSWTEIGAGSASGGGVSATLLDSWSPALVVDAAGTPLLAWGEFESGDFEIYLKTFSGGAWVELNPGSASNGGVSANTSDSGSPVLALDHAGRPVLAWTDDGSFFGAIYVKRYDAGAGPAGAWTECGAGSASGNGINGDTDGAEMPAMVLDAADRPIVAWMTLIPTEWNYEVRIKRFDGSAWVEVSPGSASGGGLSANAGDSTEPSLALDASGNPVIAWQDETPGNSEIYVKRFDGNTWQELLPGSASGGGISNSDSASTSPNVAVGAGRICVAWSEGGPTSTEILLRCAYE